MVLSLYLFLWELCGIMQPERRKCFSQFPEVPQLSPESTREREKRRRETNNKRPYKQHWARAEDISGTGRMDAISDATGWVMDSQCKSFTGWLCMSSSERQDYSTRKKQGNNSSSGSLLNLSNIVSHFIIPGRRTMDFPTDLVCSFFFNKDKIVDDCLGQCDFLKEFRKRTEIYLSVEYIQECCEEYCGVSVCGACDT